MMKRNLSAAVVFFTFCFLASQLSAAEKFDLTLINQFILDQEKEYIAEPGDMAVDRNEIIFITDKKASNIKIFDQNGKLLKTFGRKGEGPDEFQMPFTIDCYKNIFCVFDSGSSFYSIYNYSPEYEMKLENKFSFYTDATQFVIREKNIISNDYYLGREKEYRGVVLDYQGKVESKLMEIPYPRNDAKNRFFIGKAFLDVSESNKIYYVRKKNLKIYIFNKKGKQIKTFGVKPKFYSLPEMTNQYDNALRTSGNLRTAYTNWYRSFTWVSGLAILEDSILIILSDFNSRLKEWEHWYQIYDLHGNLLEKATKIKEIGSSSQLFFMDSNQKDSIYILESIGEIEPKYKFYKFKITEK